MAIVNEPEQGNPERVTEPVNEIPEKLRDKSPAELADMYQSLEKTLGRQSDELGQLRRMVTETTPPTPEPDDTDFFSDPEKAVAKTVAEQVQAALAPQRKKEAEAFLDANHAGWRDTVKSEEFTEWVSKSKARTNLYWSADDGDNVAAGELFGWWSDLKGNNTGAEAKAVDAVKKDRKIRSASTEKGTGHIDGRRVLSRVDLQELKRTNPDRYNQMLPDIRKAYTEGRVK